MRDSLTGTPHRPVLPGEVVRHLVLRRDGTYVDGTLGDGGHAEAILLALGDKGRLLGIDRDEEALQNARRRLQAFGERILFSHGSYEDLESAAGSLGTRQVDGILLDLGISSLQIGRPERGFSFSREGPLDMRMDLQDEMTAARLVALSSEREIEGILREYGEEPFAGRIARAIVEARRKGPIRTTTGLASIVGHAVPGRHRAGHHRKIHPATRTFQALRIAVNGEIGRLTRFLEKVPAFLAPGGRLAILSYHSLEDRPVKRTFVAWERQGIARRITRKAIRPADEEIRENPRARSARLRIAEITEARS